MHLSHLNEDLERWWAQVAVPRPAARDDAPRPLGARQDVHDRRGHLPRRARGRRAQRPGALRRGRSQRDIADGLAPAGRHARRLRRRCGRAARRSSSAPTSTRSTTCSRRARSPAEASPTPTAGLHFVAFAPTSDLFNRTRRAMDGALGDGSSLPLDSRAPALGFNSFIHATHRQNFLTPPRAHRSFPLVDRLRKRA